VQSSIIMACEIGIAVLHVRCLKLDISLFGVLPFDNHDRKCAAFRGKMLVIKKNARILCRSHALSERRYYNDARRPRVAI